MGAKKLTKGQNYKKIKCSDENMVWDCPMITGQGRWKRMGRLVKMFPTNFLLAQSNCLHGQEHSLDWGQTLTGKTMILVVCTTVDGNVMMVPSTAIAVFIATVQRKSADWAASWACWCVLCAWHWWISPTKLRRTPWLRFFQPLSGQKYSKKYLLWKIFSLRPGSEAGYLGLWRSVESVL